MVNKKEIFEENDKVNQKEEGKGGASGYWNRAAYLIIDGPGVGEIAGDWGSSHHHATYARTDRADTDRGSCLRPLNIWWWCWHATTLDQTTHKGKWDDFKS
jgi:hypothetical protein